MLTEPASATGLIDLRSDTVTKPTLEMRRAMAEADVGDDVYGEDPTVNRLEVRAAEVFGKQAGLFVPSGTMGNTVAIKAHTRHGEEVVCEARSHVFNYELAMMAWFSGCLARPVAAQDGILRWPQVCAALRPLSPHWAPTGLVSLENTHNMAGGAVTPLEVVNEICDGAHEAGLSVHLDGARVFNAATHLGCSVRELAAKLDTVMFCLSKGLCAPVGSILVGAAETIERARLYRKRLGGGMRQAGVLAAAGLIALEKMSARLGEDHEKAKELASGLAAIDGLRLEAARVQTNIVIFDIGGTGLGGAAFSAELKKRGVLANPVDASHLRMVTHHDVSSAQCKAALGAVGEVAASALAAR